MLECAASWSVRWNACFGNCVPGLLLIAQSTGQSRTRVPLASMARFDGVRPVMWVSKRSPANRPSSFSHGRALLAQFVAVPAAPMLYARATRLQRRK